MNKTDAAKAEHAEKMKKMGSSFATQARSKSDASRSWTSVEISTCQAMGHAALRLGGEVQLASTIQMFGGLPLDVAPLGFGQGSSDGPCLLWSAAGNVDGFGFEMVLAAVQGMAEDEVATGRGLRHLDGGGSFLSRWLRRGLVNQGEQDADDCDGNFNVQSAINQAAERSWHVSSPVGCCFGNDNPVALAILLSDASRFEALLEAEPSGIFVCEVSKDEYLPFALRAKEAEAEDAWMEKTLFWHALNCGAWRCAALLAAIPEFGAKALTPKTLGFGFADSYRSQQSRREKSNILPAENDGIFADSFARALRMAEVSIDRGNWRYKSESWLVMIESMIISAPAEAKTWLSSDGLSLPEIVLGGKPERYQRVYYEIGSVSSPETLAAGKRILAAFESSGFDMHWEALSRRCADIPMLGNWIALKVAVANEGAELSAAASQSSTERAKPSLRM